MDKCYLTVLGVEISVQTVVRDLRVRRWSVIHSKHDVVRMLLIFADVCCCRGGWSPFKDVDVIASVCVYPSLPATCLCFLIV